MANIANIAMLAELDGAILVDKPAGISAHDVMKAVKTRFNLVKLGHGGTLDAPATGLFILLLGDATRFSNDLMGADRAYSVTLTLGVETDTCDRTGSVISEKPIAEVTRVLVRSPLKVEFVKFLRPERKFRSIAALGRQIAADIAAARMS